MTEYEYYQKRKPFKTVDIIVLVFGLILFVSGFLFLLPKLGNTVVISVDGERYASYSLAKNQTIYLEEMEIVIQNGEVKVINSSCSNKFCQQQGNISKVHECIVCIPNRIIIFITGEAEYDTIIGGAA